MKRIESYYRFLPEWLARKACALTAAVPPRARKWVEESARALPADPDRIRPERWAGAIEKRFCRSLPVDQRPEVVRELTAAVLLAALRRRRSRAWSDRVRAWYDHTRADS